MGRATCNKVNSSTSIGKTLVICSFLLHLEMFGIVHSSILMYLLQVSACSAFARMAGIGFELENAVKIFQSSFFVVFCFCFE